jgi:essential nuclear protein 1
MPKAPGGDARQMRRHNPLSEDYAPSNPHKQKAPKKKSRSNPNGDEDNEQQAYIDSKASRKIIALGQDLTAEEDAELEALRPKNDTKSAFEFERSLRDEEDSDDDEAGGIPGDDEAWGDEDDEEVEEVEVDPEDLAMFNKFNPEFDPATLLGAQADEGESTNLADLILSKIAQHESSQAQGHIIRGGGAPEDAIELPAKVVEVYTQYV